VCSEETASYSDPLGLNAAMANAIENAAPTLHHVASAIAGNVDPDHHALSHLGQHGYFRDLTDHELALASASDPIVITAPRLTSTYSTLNTLMWSVDGYDYYGGSSSQPDPPCWWGMNIGPVDIFPGTDLTSCPQIWCAKKRHTLYLRSKTIGSLNLSNLLPPRCYIF
jgi:hypothetical protein